MALAARMLDPRVGRVSFTGRPAEPRRNVRGDRQISLKGLGHENHPIEREPRLPDRHTRCPCLRHDVNLAWQVFDVEKHLLRRIGDSGRSRTIEIAHGAVKRRRVAKRRVGRRLEQHDESLGTRCRYQIREAA